MKKKKRTGTQAAKLLVSTHDISFIRYVTEKVSRCSRAKQLQNKTTPNKCTKKCAARAKLLLLLLLFLFLLAN